MPGGPLCAFDFNSPVFRKTRTPRALATISGPAIMLEAVAVRWRRLHPLLHRTATALLCAGLLPFAITLPPALHRTDHHETIGPPVLHRHDRLFVRRLNRYAPSKTIVQSRLKSDSCTSALVFASPFLQTSRCRKALGVGYPSPPSGWTGLAPGTVDHARHTREKPRECNSRGSGNLKYNDDRSYRSRRYREPLSRTTATKQASDPRRREQAQRGRFGNCSHR